MAGLPRSGSTLLSAILNQNPDVYSGPQTDFPSMMLSIYHENQSHFNRAITQRGM
jgi:hypothetical protein